MKILGIQLIIVLLFSGCASGLYQAVDNQKYDKENSYVSFIRPFGAKAYSYTILEIDPATNATKLVGIIGDSSNLIYETTPGEKYFYVSTRETNGMAILATGLHSLAFKLDRGDIIKINAGKGKIYQFFYDQSKANLVFYPLDGRNFKLLDKIKNSECNPENIAKFDLEKVSTEGDFIKIENYENNEFKVTVECKNKKFYNPRYFQTNLDDIKDYKIITKNKKTVEHFQKNKDTYIEKIQSLLTDYKYNLKVDKEFGLDIDYYRNY